MHGGECKKEIITKKRFVKGREKLKTKPRIELKKEEGKREMGEGGKKTGDTILKLKRSSFV